jgi:ribosomal protein S18 acetylase RimI-like enzyme
MITIGPAGPDEVPAVAALQIALFREDAGVHEPRVDLTWPVREGERDISALIDRPDCVVLVARDGADVVGFLAAYVATASASRVPHSYAELRSLYVAPGGRRQGAARALVLEFLAWAREQGCADARVDAYAANQGAQHFYESLGFDAQSVSRVLSL